METRKVRIEVDVVIEISPEELEYNITGGAEGEDAIQEAISYTVQEIEYSFDCPVKGINVVKTELIMYS